MEHTIKNIYGHLGDAESRQIYANRLLYSLTEDRMYMTDIIKHTELYRKVHGIMTDDKKKKYIASAGQWGRIIADLFWESGFSGMIDNYVTGSYRGLPIRTMDKFMTDVSDATVYIASTTFHAEFVRMLEGAGISSENIVDVTGMMLDIYHRCQYFDLPYMTEHKMKKEVFVDGGCYDGENSKMFAEWVGNGSKTIYAFEPDENNFRNCRAVLDGIKEASYQLIPKGLWSCEKTLDFKASANEGSRLADGGGERVPVTR